jgi:hypothetical protein
LYAINLDAVSLFTDSSFTVVSDFEFVLYDVFSGGSRKFWRWGLKNITTSKKIFLMFNYFFVTRVYIDTKFSLMFNNDKFLSENLLGALKIYNSILFTILWGLKIL